MVGITLHWWVEPPTSISLVHVATPKCPKYKYCHFFSNMYQHKTKMAFAIYLNSNCIFLCTNRKYVYVPTKKLSFFSTYFLYMCDQKNRRDSTAAIWLPSGSGSAQKTLGIWGNMKVYESLWKSMNIYENLKFPPKLSLVNSCSERNILGPVISVRVTATWFRKHERARTETMNDLAPFIIGQS